jgi:prepilin-type N-terminal cleavage/methylation domain-containing protein
MNLCRRGFTVLELIIALVIGSILTSIALTSYHNAQGRFAVRGARDMFASLQARARAQAISSGSTIRVVVDVSGDSVYLWQSGTNLETHRFADEHVDLHSDVGNFYLCMNSRGYADDTCNSFSTSATLTFVQNGDSASVEILPLGQLIY